jgi:hypothetical protein
MCCLVTWSFALLDGDWQTAWHVHVRMNGLAGPTVSSRGISHRLSTEAEATLIVLPPAPCILLMLQPQRAPGRLLEAVAGQSPVCSTVHWQTPAV